MAAAAVATAVPDYLSDPDACLKDTEVTWRLGRAPDYSKTRKYWKESKWLFLQSLPSTNVCGLECRFLVLQAQALPRVDLKEQYPT